MARNKSIGGSIMYEIGMGEEVKQYIKYNFFCQMFP